MSALTTRHYPEYVASLTSGFIREQQSILSLYMAIPQGIIVYIMNYFPFLFSFGIYDSSKFDLINGDNMMIQGISKDDCDGYPIYADLFGKNETGFNSGVHYWSIKALHTDWYKEDGKIPEDHYSFTESDCYRCIGVTTIKKNIHDIHEPTAPFKFGAGRSYHFDGFIQGWGFGQIITLKLDCNIWVVSYYKDGKFIKSQRIQENENYFLALSCCTHHYYTKLEVVDTPQVVFDD